MKKITSFITCLFLLGITFINAQAPQAFSYQAIARNSGGTILTNQSVSFQLKLTLGNPGTLLYTETHSTITDANGVVDLEIGRGSTSDNFFDIDWSTANIYLQVEMDPLGGTAYAAVGTSELLSVPYALHSGSGNQFGVNVTDARFGGPISGDWSTAFQNAIDFLAVNQGTELAGGVIFIPAGEYILNSGIRIYTNGTGDLPSITLEGEGMHSTILNFNNSGDGITLEESHFVKLRNFCVRRSTANNILIEDGGSHIELTNIRSSFAAKSGIKFERDFMITMRDVFSTHNTWHGFEFSGYSTSVGATNCYADNNTLDGWLINNMTYSTFTSCASDNNRRAWSISKVEGVTLLGCGAEFSDAGFYVIADGASNQVSNLSIEGCFTHEIDYQSSYSSLLYVKTLNGGKAKVYLRNSSDNNHQGNYSVVANGNNAIIIDDNNILEANPIVVNGGEVRTPKQLMMELGPISSPTSNTPIASINSLIGSTIAYSGLFTIEARNQPANVSSANSASYVILVTKSVLGTSVVKIASAGLIAGGGSNWPSFNFGINSSNQLTVSPIGSTGPGESFYFHVSYTGNIDVGKL